MKITLLKVTTICAFFMCTIGLSQTTLIPDSNFEQKLIDEGIDSDGIINGQVLTADIASITDLNLFNSGITNVQGIEDFAALDYLNLGNNAVTNLDVSNNTNLTTLNVSFTALTSLDISNSGVTFLEVNHSNISSLNVSNTSLNHLNGSHSDLVSLDVSNTDLNFLDVSSTDITTLDVSDKDIAFLDVSNTDITSLIINNNPDLISLNARNTMLTYLDLRQTNLQYINISNNSVLDELDLRNGNNTAITYFKTTGTPNLTCISVDNKDYSEANWTNIDSVNTFSNNCYDSLSIDDSTLEASVSIFPNPFTNYVTIDFNSNIELKHIEVYNILGQVVVTTKQTTIQTENLQSGIYLIQIKTDKGILTKKVIKK